MNLSQQILSHFLEAICKISSSGMMEDVILFVPPKAFMSAQAAVHIKSHQAFAVRNHLIDHQSVLLDVHKNQWVLLSVPYSRDILINFILCLGRTGKIRPQKGKRRLHWKDRFQPFPVYNGIFVLFRIPLINRIEQFSVPEFLAGARHILVCINRMLPEE